MTFTAGIKRTTIFAATIVLSLAATATANAGCTDPVAPNVDWSVCNMGGASLRKAKMGGAYLRYVDLTQTDLSSAGLANVNLSGADLYDANLTGADLTGAKLSGATWIDGRICAKGSIGVCN
mgnify:CR=1 FL=1